MKNAYYTLCKVDVMSGQWFDQFGATTRAECADEMESLIDGYTPRRHFKIVKSDGSAESMIAARDALEIPNGFKAFSVFVSHPIGTITKTPQPETVCHDLDSALNYAFYRIAEIVPDCTVWVETHLGERLEIMRGGC